MTPDYDRARPLRIPDDEWQPFEAATKAVHPKGRSPRTAVVREFIRWYMRRPGATLPKRPDLGHWSTTTDDTGTPLEIPAEPVANPRRTKAADQD